MTLPPSILEAQFQPLNETSKKASNYARLDSEVGSIIDFSFFQVFAIGFTSNFTLEPIRCFFVPIFRASHIYDHHTDMKLIIPSKA